MQTVLCLISDKWAKAVACTNRQWAICLFLTCLTATLYFPAANFDYIDYDDPIYASDNTYVIDGLTPASIQWAFSTTFGYYHPIAFLSLMADSTLFGPTPFAHHISNIILHCACVVMLFLISVRCCNSILWSTVGAMAFSLHPINIESVAWISERKGLISALFSLISIYYYITFRRKRRVSSMIVLCTLFILGYLAKPSIVVLPLALILLEFWLSENDAGKSKYSLKNEIRWNVPLLVLSLLGAFACYFTQVKSGAVAIGIPIYSKLSNAFNAYSISLSKVLLPLNLAPLYPHNTRSGIGSVVLLLLALFSVYTICRRSPLSKFWGNLRFVSIWYTIWILPVLGIISFGPALIADRYAYLPLAGLMLGASKTMSDIQLRLSSQKTRFSLGLGALCVLLALTFLAEKQLRMWRNTETLFIATLQRTQRNAVAHCVLATHLHTNRRYREAETQFLEALQISPRYTLAWYNLGLTLVELNRLAEATTCFEAANRLAPTTMETSENARRAHEQQQNPETKQ